MAPGGVLWDGVLVNQLIDVRCVSCRRLYARGRSAEANGGVSLTYEDDGDLGSHCD